MVFTCASRWMSSSTLPAPRSWMGATSICMPTIFLAAPWPCASSAPAIPAAACMNSLRCMEQLRVSDFLGVFQQAGNVLDSHTRPGRDTHLPVFDLDARVQPASVSLHSHLVFLILGQ